MDTTNATTSAASLPDSLVDPLPPPAAKAAKNGAYNYVQVITGVATLGALAFGYDTGVIAGALPYMSRAATQGGLGLTPLTEGAITAALIFGAALGSFIGGRLSDRYGRRAAILILALVFFTGALGTAGAPDIALMAATRFFLGMGVGGASAVVPVFIAEIAPPNRRARLVTRSELMIVTGQMLAYVCSAVLAHVLHDPAVWRVMLAVAAVPALLLWLGMVFMPESPRWLALHNREDEARAVMARIRQDPAQRERELAGMMAATSDVSEATGLSELRTPWIRNLMLIGIGLGFVAQFTGVNAFMYFTPIILQSTGMGTEAALTGTIGNGVIAVLSTLLGIWLITRNNRRALLMTGLVGAILCLMGLGAVLQLMPDGTGRSYIALAIIFAFMFFQQGMISTIYWLLMSELFPQRMRGVVTGLVVAVMWMFNAAVAFLFPILLDWLGGETFFLLAALNVASLAFVWHFVPETRGKSLETLEQHLEARLSPAE
ncbi:MAG: sugar porter family MFS transporter [Azospirillaceae bacterium]|nr:sugar porter family MFS transporter [Azospirillaceae bacterium]